MPEYTSTVPVYVDGVYVEAGKPFDTDKPKGSTWTATDPSSETVEPVADPVVAAPVVGRDDQDKRDTDIAATLDLLDEHDFVKTGNRAGRPKCSAIENIVGYPVFTDEVDAAWDKRAA